MQAGIRRIPAQHHPRYVANCSHTRVDRGTVCRRSGAPIGCTRIRDGIAISQANQAIPSVPLPAPDPITPSRLLHCVAGPTVAVRPKRALRADLSFGVIDPLLMWATYDSIRHDDRYGAMIPHEPEDVATNGRICPNVALLGEPTFQSDRLGVLRGHNPNCDFAGAFVIRPVERNRRDRIAPKATTCLFLQR